MTRERPTTKTPRTCGAPLRALVLASVAVSALIALPGATRAQEPPAEAAASGDAASTGRPRRPAAFETSPSQRGTSLTSPATPSRSGTFGTASGSAFGSEGNAAGSDASVSEEGVSRLPRFRTGAPGLTDGSAAGLGPGGRPSLLRQRAIPPRRLGSATRVITQTRTQQSVTDLRLTPVIRSPVSGLPLPTAIAPLGLVNPANLLGFGLGIGAPGPLTVDPAYAPLGLRFGAFTVLPAFTQSIGYDTNPNQTLAARARPSLALRSEGEVAIRSDWSQAEFTSEMRGSYLDYPDNPEASRPNAVGVSRLRLDANRDTRIDVETRFLLDSQRAGSPDLNAAAAVRPLFASYGATVGVQETFNRLQLSLRGSIDRQVFEDARLSDGTVIRQSDRDANQYGVRLRAGYEISPAITPFVETLIDTRVYDTPIDQFGLRRDSDGIAFTAGARVELSRVLSAEVSAGLQHRSYVDRSLRPIQAPLVSAALIWSVSPLTTVRFNQQTGVIETSVPGSSGAFTDVASVEVQHDLLRNLTITLGGTYLANTYDGVPIRERGFSTIARLDYRFNRWLTFRGSYLYSTLTSTSANSSYDGHAVLLGVRVNP
ncbi:outer membrane beta-barrel protein [Methylobacterium sp. Leaf118]|uniref:outer membrane beta-barrel protein n=1 Tax=Methylobacterium sp. Leaf118 TaxID=2876562 RepID=UPI001E53D23E|nr:outer membrane beta-barrel protein [Methylobacterium sp. Leaf118]